MPAKYRIPLLTSILLLAAAPPFAAAETPLPDPVPPAVIGRPLDQIRPARPARQKPATAAKANRPKPLATARSAAPKLSDETVVVAPQQAAPAAPPAQAAVAQPAVATAAAPGAARAPKQEADRTDPQAKVADNVGQGSEVGIKPTAPGVYFGIRDQALIRKFYEAQPASGKGGRWKIGEPVPPRVTMRGVPDEVRAALSPVPPGHQYVQVDDEVVLVAVESRMVVDGVSRAVR
jgi:Ni/Co efflux regulator RcnB